MPDVAWSNWGELRNYNDCSTEALDEPRLGEVNVTLPDWKSKQLRRAYYASISHVDSEIGRVLEELESLGTVKEFGVIVRNVSFCL